MDEKKKKESDGENNDNAKKKEENPSSTTVVLNVDLHYDGCAAKILRFLRSFQALKLDIVVEGVESVKVKSEVGKLTIVYPSKLKEKLERKTNKTIDRISPLPNKNKKLDNNKKPKEPLVTTVVLKVAFHCQGCAERIRKTVLKTKGVHEVAMDKEKEIVTVKGTMEVKTLVENLMQRLKRKVEVVPPKKDDNDNKEDKDKEGVPDKRESGAATKKKKGGDDNGEYGGDDDGKLKQSGMDFAAPALMPYGLGNGYYGYDYGYNYGPLYMGKVHAPQIFSDENPNACSAM